MPRIAPVTSGGLDDTNRRRRHREVTDLMLNFQHDDSRIRTQAEVSAGVTPGNYAFASSPSAWLNVFRFFTDAERNSCLARNGLVDHTAAIQRANNFLEGNVTAGLGGQPHPGGTLYFPAGLYNVSSQLRVGGNVTWKGDNFLGTTFNLSDAAFTGNWIVLGPDASGIWPWSSSYTVGSSIEDMNFSAFDTGLASSIITTPGAHQFSHLKRLKFTGFNQIGINLSSTGGPAYFRIEDIDATGGTVDGLAIARTAIWQGSGSILTMSNISTQGQAAHHVSIGIRVNLGAIAATNLHFENVDDGVYFDNQSAPNCSVIHGISGNASTTNLIHIPNPCNQTVTATAILAITGDPAHPVAIKNDVTGEVILNTMVGLYSWSGETSGFRSGSLGYSALHNTPRIRYGKSATQAIAQNTVVVLTFPTKTHDWQSVSEWSGSVYTPKIPGPYRVTVSVQLASATWAAGNRFVLGIRKNGASQSNNEDQSAIGTFITQLQHTDTVYCSPGDTIDTFVFQGAAASINTDSTATTCYIAIERA